MSKRRDSFTPGQQSSSKGSGTMMVRKEGLKRVQHRPGLPPRDEPEDDDEEPIAAGALGPGRGLPSSSGPPPQEEPPPDDNPRRPVAGGASPFSGYAPTADELAHAAAAGAESSNQVAAIVLGMGFVLSVATVLVLIILGIGLFAWSQSQNNDGVADGDGDPKGHIRDTAVGKIKDPQPRAAPRPGPGGGEPDPEDPEAPVVAPTTGPVSITVPEKVFFHSLEINCPDAGIRRRAKFRGRKASTTGVPINEDCAVTFQGSEPAKTYISGGQDKDCVSFNPTECRLK